MGVPNTKLNKPVQRERSDSVWGSGDLRTMKLPGVDQIPSPNIQYYALVKNFSGLVKMDPNETKEANDYLDYRCVTSR